MEYLRSQLALLERCQLGTVAKIVKETASGSDKNSQFIEFDMTKLPETAVCKLVDFC